MISKKSPKLKVKRKRAPRKLAEKKECESCPYLKYAILGPACAKDPDVLVLLRLFFEDKQLRPICENKK